MTRGSPRVDAQRPDTWQKFQKDLCKGCWAGCCTLPLEVSAADLIRLGLTSEEEASVSLKKLARRLLLEGWIQTYRDKTGVFVVQQKNGRDCIFLDQNRLCTVYERRPQVCRSFPKIGPRPGHCPAIKVSKK